ncbi:MAG: hypothetical protein RR715_06275, partial [Comamonas sp.]
MRFAPLAGCLKNRQIRQAGQVASMQQLQDTLKIVGTFVGTFQKKKHGTYIPCGFQGTFLFLLRG